MKRGWKNKNTPIIVGSDKNPTKMESGQVIINKKATKKNLDKLIEINNDSSKPVDEKVTTDGTNGGLLKGKPHYDENGKPLGGIPVVVDGVKNIEVEGEEFVVNKEASQKHWKELSKINQSAGNGVPINPSDVGTDEDPEEFKKGGLIQFNPNHLPNSLIYYYAKKVKEKYPQVWDMGGNIFGNEAFKNLERVIKRGYWTENEEWMYIKWRSYVARHKQDFRIAGVIAMLKWVDKVDKGWPYMKDLIEKEIDKKYPKKGFKTKMAKGGGIDYLIEKGIVDLKFYETTTKHAKEYRVEAKKPLYVQNLYINEKERLKGIGKETLEYLNDYAKKNGNDVIFGYIAEKVEFTKDSKKSFNSNVQSIKDWLHKNGYVVNNESNDFHKIVNKNIDPTKRLPKMKTGGNIEDENIFELTNYIVTANTDTDTKEIYYGTDYERALLEFNSTNNSDIGEFGGTALLEKKINVYKFIGDLEDGYYEISDFPIEDYYNDKDYYEIISEGEIEVIESKDIKPINEKSDEILQEVEQYYKNKYGRYKYNQITVDNGKDEYDDDYVEYGCIQLRIADHSENVRNIDKFGGCDYYISVVIAQQDKTKSKFLTSVFERRSNEIEINFNEDDNFDDIISAIEEKIENGKEYILERTKMQTGGTTDDFDYTSLFNTSEEEEEKIPQEAKIKDKYHLGGRIKNMEFMKWFVDWYRTINKQMNINFSVPNILSPFKEDNVIILDLFEKINQDIDAKPYLNKIIEKADEFGVVIYLEPNPRYENFGFELTTNGQFMKRLPKMKNGGELAKGIKTEQEHKKTLEKIASGEITVQQAIEMTAKDHLKENPNYYTELAKIEKHEVGGALSSYSLNTPTGEKSRLTYLQQVLARTDKFKEFFGDWESAAKSYLLDEKENFEKHYKNVSKVLDMVTLEPRVVYHGTRSDKEFFTFDVSMEKGQGRPYAYFAHNREYSQNFTEFSQRNHDSSNPYLYECFLNIRNPFMAVGHQYEFKKRDYNSWINVITGTIAWDKYKTIVVTEETKRLEKAIRVQIEDYMSSLPDDKNQFWKFMARDSKSLFKFFLVSYGYDGIFYGEEIASDYDPENERQYTRAVTVFSAKDIKLADGRNLNFNPMETDIRYKDGGSVERPEIKMSKKDKLGSLLFGEKYEKGGFISEAQVHMSIDKPIEESRLFVEELNKKMKE